MTMRHFVWIIMGMSLSPCLATIVAAQTVPTVSFVAPRVYTVGQTPAFLAVSDFNGDGKSDVAVANKGSGNVSVLLGNGDGSLQAAVDTPSGVSPVAVVAGDLNGDGKLDLVVTDAGSSTNNVLILLGNGDGTFNPGTNLTVPSASSALAIADFNGDGKLDLAVGTVVNSTVSQVMIFLGNGDGTFGNPVGFSVGNSPGFIAVGDLNGDQKADLVVANGDGTLSTLLGNGDGTFGTARSFIEGATPRWIVIADFNRDGKGDLAVADFNQTTVFLGNGDGTFGSPNGYAGGIGGDSVAVADLNGDGILDLVVAGAASQILLGKGDGTFTTKTGVGIGGAAVAIVDLNKDGKPDIVSSQVCVALGNGDGTFIAAQLVGTGGTSLVAGDFNGGGKDDFALLSYPYPSGNISMFLGNGDGTFQKPTNTNFTLTRGVWKMAAGYFNADGLPDLAVTWGGAIFISKGGGTFTTEPQLNALGFQLAVGDFNGDGKSDIAVLYDDVLDGCTNFGDIFLGNGDGTFQAGIPLSLPIECSDYIAAGDFNGDGNSDLSIGGATYLSNGDGTFQMLGSGCVSGFAGVRGDFNKDGKLDLAVETGTEVDICLGNGDGTFRPPVSYPANVPAPDYFSSEIHTADLNGDGALDLVWGDVTVLLGNGDGTFQQAIQFVAGSGAGYSTAIGDFNGDGKPDILVTVAPQNNNAGTTYILVNDTGGIASLNLAVPVGGSNTATVSAGKTASYSLSIGGGGFAGTANLTCSGAPTGATCSLPASVNVSATNASMFTVTVTTTARSSAAIVPNSFMHSGWLWAVAMMGIVILPSFSKKRRLSAARCLPIAFLLFIASCGGGGSSGGGGGGNGGGTPAGNYTVTVKATSGPLVESLPLTLTVQ